MIIIFVVLAGFVSSRVRPTLLTFPLFFFHFHLLYPLPGTGFLSQTRRGAFDKLAYPPWNLARFASGPFLSIRQKAAYAVASLALVFFALDYSHPLCATPPPYTTDPLALFLFPIFLLRTIIFLLPLSSKFGFPPPLSASLPLPLLIF
jgi:hypothetical protein